MSAPKEIRDLVERFEENKASYLNPSYNEAMLRRDFLDPLFKALGWDMDNIEGNAEACVGKPPPLHGCDGLPGGEAWTDDGKPDSRETLRDLLMILVGHRLVWSRFASGSRSTTGAGF